MPARNGWPRVADCSGAGLGDAGTGASARGTRGRGMRGETRRAPKRGRRTCGSGVHRSRTGPRLLLSAIMSPLDLPEPPTDATIAHARAKLALYDADAKSLSQHIQDASDALARIVEEQQSAIRDLEKDLAALEDKVALTRAYISPIKRLPHELLRHIFLFIFDDCSWSAWVLAAVSPLWRRLSLSMPKLWSKVSSSPPARRCPLLPPPSPQPRSALHPALSPANPSRAQSCLRLVSFRSTCAA